MFGRTFSVLANIIFGINARKDIGRQFSKSRWSFPFFSIKVMIACFWESDISEQEECGLAPQDKKQPNHSLSNGLTNHSKRSAYVTLTIQN